MSATEDILKIKKKLESMMANDAIDDANVNDLLNTLKKIPMTYEILQKTKIGMTINNFRKMCDKDSIVLLAKSLIKNWKKLVSGDSSVSSLNKSSSSSASLPRSSSTGSAKDEDSMDSSMIDPQMSENSSKVSPKPDLQRQTSFPAAPETTDAVRVKCRELLTTALKTPPGVEGSTDFAEVAAQIEEAIFNEFKRTDPKYKNRVRSRVANLKDSRNPDLRHNVLCGLIPPDRISCMTAEEMASNDLKEMRSKFTKEAINEHQLSRISGTKTDLFKCGRCHQRHCSYNQVQTRSADEPMTTFVLCNECGNRWKFC